MKDYGVYKNDLDALTMETAKEIEATCEKDALDLAKKVGIMWKPTRQMAWEAHRTAYSAADDAEDKAKAALWVSILSAAVSLVCLIILSMAR